MSLPVTLDDAKAHLRVDTDAEDGDIGDKLLSAQAAVLGYLKVASLDALAVGSPAAIPAPAEGAIKAATLLMVGYFYRERDSDENHEWEQGYLPRPVTALLYQLRDPACA